MIFEQAYGQWLVRELNSKLQEIDDSLFCKLFDEIGYKPLYNEPDTIAVVISGGNASRSSVAGQDQNILPLSVTVICKEIYSTSVRNAIDLMQKEFNAVPIVLHYYDRPISADAADQTRSIKVKSVFSTPFVFNSSDYKTQSETIKAVFIPFSASVSYGETAFINPDSVSLKIGETTYEINHIADYNKAAQPAYDSYQGQGKERLDQVQLTITHSFAYTIYKVEGDALQEIFETELNCRDGLNGKEIAVILDGKEIRISTWSLVESYANNAAAYTLTLGV